MTRAWTIPLMTQPRRAFSCLIRRSDVFYAYFIVKITDIWRRGLGFEPTVRITAQRLSSSKIVMLVRAVP